MYVLEPSTLIQYKSSKYRNAHVKEHVHFFYLYSLNMQYVYATIGIFLLYTIAELNVYSK